MHDPSKRRERVKQVLWALTAAAAGTALLLGLGPRLQVTTQLVAYDWPPLHQALADDRPLAEIEQILDQDPAAMHQNAEVLGTPLVYAAGENRVDVVKLLLSEGADVNQPSHGGRDDVFRGYSLLHMAAFKGNEELIRIALEAGANVDQEVPGKGTAADIARRHGHEEMARLIEEYPEAKVEAQN